jgi:hypothetical protein
MIGRVKALTVVKKRRGAKGAVERNWEGGNTPKRKC